MRIGIDGGALSVSDDRLKVGVYRVSYNLVKELPRLSVKHFYRVYGFGRGGEGVEQLADPHVQFVPLVRPGYQKIWQSLEILRNPIDIYIGLAQTVPPLPTILCDVKKIGVIYDVGFLTHPEYYPRSAHSLKKRTAELVARSDHILTISESSKQAICRMYALPGSQVSVAYLGIESVFTARGIAHKGRRPYFLFAGALKPGKNVPFIIRAFAEFLKESKVLYDLLLVGSAYWLDPKIRETIVELELGKRVHLVGFVSDEKLASYYRGATALVSVSHIEGFGLPAVEAMACGCPVIVSTVGSYPEVVGDAGTLVSPDDELAITRAMERMVKDPAFRTTCVRKGQAKAKQFRWKKFARTVELVVRKVGGSGE